MREAIGISQLWNKMCIHRSLYVVVEPLLVVGEECCSVWACQALVQANSLHPLLQVLGTLREEKTFESVYRAHKKAF